MRGETFHSVSESLAKRPYLEKAYNKIMKAIDEAGVGSMGERLTQSASKIPTPGAQKRIAESRAIEVEHGKAFKKPLMVQKQRDRAAASTHMYEHGTKFFIEHDNARVVASFRKGPKDRVRAVDIVSVGNREWPILTKDSKTGKKMPYIPDLTREFMR